MPCAWRHKSRFMTQQGFYLLCEVKAGTLFAKTLFDLKEMNMPDEDSERNIMYLARQLHMDKDLLFQEICWALGEERINRVMPAYDQFREWDRTPDGLYQFWCFANSRLSTDLTPDEVRDTWRCIDLTLNARKRRPFTFQDYLMIAINSDRRCEYCGKAPPEVKLEIDHILPVSKGGSNVPFNLRFLCQHHNRSKGNRFHWADIWRRML